MPAHQSFDDPILGHVAWDDQRHGWQCHPILQSGKPIPCTIFPEDERLTSKGLDELCRCVRWLQHNEPAVRERITAIMFQGWWEGWYDEEIDTVNTKEQFREAISLSGINVYEDWKADLIYNDGHLFGGHAIVLTIGPDGDFIYDPQIWG